MSSESKISAGGDCSPTTSGAPEILDPSTITTQQVRETLQAAVPFNCPCRRNDPRGIGDLRRRGTLGCPSRTESSRHNPRGRVAGRRRGRSRRGICWSASRAGAEHPHEPPRRRDRLQEMGAWDDPRVLKRLAAIL